MLFPRVCRQAHMVKTDKNKKGKEIPIPQVRIVPTYEQDYLPVYERPATYVRGKGTCEILHIIGFLSSKRCILITRT